MPSNSPASSSSTRHVPLDCSRTTDRRGGRGPALRLAARPTACDQGEAARHPRDALPPPRRRCAHRLPRPRELGHVHGRRRDPRPAPASRDAAASRERGHHAALSHRAVRRAGLRRRAHGPLGQGRPRPLLPLRTPREPRCRRLLATARTTRTEAEKAIGNLLRLVENGAMPADSREVVERIAFSVPASRSPRPRSRASSAS